jgi:hypothetical protein
MAYHGTYAYDILWHLMSYDIQVHKNDWNLKVVSGLCHVTSTRFHGRWCRCQGLKPYRKEQELTSWHTSHVLLWISEVNFLWLPASPVGMWPCGRGRKEAGRRCLASLRLNRLKPGDNDIHLEKLAKKGNIKASWQRFDDALTKHLKCSFSLSVISSCPSSKSMSWMYCVNEFVLGKWVSRIQPLISPVELDQS